MLQLKYIMCSQGLDAQVSWFLLVGYQEGSLSLRGKRQEKRGWEVGVPRRREQGELRKILQQFVIFCNKNGANRREPLWKGVGSWSKRYGK